MRGTVLGVAAIALAVVPSIVGASTNHPSRPGAHVLADGVRSCGPTSLSTWYRYSDGSTWTVVQRLSPGEHEFVVSHDPQGRALPHSILVHDTPLVCVTDVL